MDTLLYKIALAGYMHDIGKFAERARSRQGEGSGFEVDDVYIRNNQMLYQPFKKYENRFTHAHALFTAYFIEKFAEYLPSELIKHTSDEESFINIAAKHHKPESPFHWIITVADRVSSGFDRTKLENIDEEERDYRQVRLVPIFESISLSKKWKKSIDEYKFRYALKKISPENIFPSENFSENDYKKLFDDFINDFRSLKHKDKLPLWFEHFDSLCMYYLSHVPSSTLRDELPDISLYDHMRVTSALATALYKYHADTNTMVKNEIKDYEKEKFLLVTGDFYGIQDFIFSSGGSTSQASAKILRGRSFYVSLIIELASDMLCRKVGVPFISSIYNAAGKFTVILPNTDATRESVSEVEKKINDWLIEKFYGTVSIGFATVRASCNDFVQGKFVQLNDKMSKELEKKRYSKFDIKKYGGVINTYLDSFNNELGICRFCDKRPASLEFKDEKIPICKTCRDQIFIGERLVKRDIIAVTTVDAQIPEEKRTLEPIFGQYVITFSAEKIQELTKNKKIYRIWYIGKNKNPGISVKFINGYVPVYDEEDLSEENVERILAGKKSEKLKNELFDNLEPGVPKTFSYLAKMAIEKEEDGWRGIEALGVLKADVDNLGAIFACGLKDEQITISRIATLSRQLNNFFALYLPHVLSTNEQFKNIYTVFAGGDDLFLIGPWNRIIELSGFLANSFKQYVCHNPDITISAGISIHKPNTPVKVFAEHSEDAIKKSKFKKNGITIFDETVSWEDFYNLNEVMQKLWEWLEEEAINTAMLYRMNAINLMSKREKELREASRFTLKDMECFKWRSMLYYTSVRNFAKKLKGQERQEAVTNFIATLSDWIEKYAGAFKIPLWQVIYNNRRG
ncbi:type III-A CRISPR-associated protein Cas10/Csm1 [Thermodesulfovibrio hydrogeniphilus]